MLTPPMTEGPGPDVAPLEGVLVVVFEAAGTMRGLPPLVLVFFVLLLSLLL